MKNIIINLIIISLLYQNVFSQNIKNNVITLPKIPIDAINENLRFNSDIFEIKPNESFYSYKYNKERSYKGLARYQKNLIILGATVLGYYLGSLIPYKPEEKDYNGRYGFEPIAYERFVSLFDKTDKKIVLQFTGSYILGGPIAAGFGFSDNLKEYRCYEVSRKSGLTEYIYFNDNDLNQRSFNSEAATYSALGLIIYGLGPLIGWIAYWSKPEELTESYPDNFDEQILSIDFNDQFLVDYLNVRKKIISFNQPINLEEIESWKQKSRLVLGKSKGEFETTLQYEDRLRREEQTSIEINNEYNQKIKLATENWEIEQFKSRREIEDLVNKLHFIQTYAYDISDYNADKQKFTFISNNSKDYFRKDIIIPSNEARAFKLNTSNLVIQKVLKPTLDGKWVSVSSDYVLIDTKKNEIIPWEGEVPLIAERINANPPKLSARIKINEQNGNGFLDAGETAELKVTLLNNGGMAGKTRISLSQTDGPVTYYDVTNSMNEIKQNDSINTKFKITIPQNIIDGKATYKLTFMEAQGYEPSPLSFVVETRAEKPPLLALVDFGVIDQNNDGKVSKGENAEVTARIQNRGQGMAKGVIVKVIDNPDKNIFLAPYSQKEFNIGEIPAGESRDVNFTFLTNNRASELVELNLKIDEERLSYSTKDVIKVEIEKQQKQIEPLLFTGVEKKVDINDIKTLSIDIEQNIPVTKQKNPNAVAVIIGIKEYANSDIPTVEYAKRDAIFMREYLIKVLGYDSKNILPQNPDELMTVGNMKNLIRNKLPRFVKPDESSDIFIYYVGHGAPSTESQQPFFVPYDCDPNFVSNENAYKMEEFYQDIAKIKSKKKIVVIDACFSGQSGDGKSLVKNASPVLLKVDNTLFKDKNAVVFQSSKMNQVSNWYPEKKHGMFTYFFLKGLKGEADGNKDGKITLQELGNYINDENNNLPYVSGREFQRLQEAVVIGAKDEIISNIK